MTRTRLATLISSSATRPKDYHVSPTLRELYETTYGVPIDEITTRLSAWTSEIESDLTQFLQSSSRNITHDTLLYRIEEKETEITPSQLHEILFELIVLVVARDHVSPQLKQLYETTWGVCIDKLMTRLSRWTIQVERDLTRFLQFGGQQITHDDLFGRIEQEWGLREEITPGLFREILAEIAMDNNIDMDWVGARFTRYAPCQPRCCSRDERFQHG